MNKLNAWTFVTDILRPLFKACLEQLAEDVRLIIRSLVGTVSTLAPYSLIPGRAGLVSRRRFTFWFLASFFLLLAIDKTGFFESISGNAQPMPGSERLVILLVSQVALLILAFRLRRSSRSM